ncbi:hypothetical protein KM043_007280 [Ampulex compressa]|nr:hypothetical protein KM043_007280 [Ampulex compressa]
MTVLTSSVGTWHFLTGARLMESRASAATSPRRRVNTLSGPTAPYGRHSDHYDSSIDLSNPPCEASSLPALAHSSIGEDDVESKLFREREQQVRNGWGNLRASARNLSLLRLGHHLATKQHSIEIKSHSDLESYGFQNNSESPFPYEAGEPISSQERRTKSENQRRTRRELRPAGPTPPSPPSETRAAEKQRRGPFVSARGEPPSPGRPARKSEGGKVGDSHAGRSGGALASIGGRGYVEDRGGSRERTEDRSREKSPVAGNRGEVFGGWRIERIEGGGRGCWIKRSSTVESSGEFFGG